MLLRVKAVNLEREKSGHYPGLRWPFEPVKEKLCASAWIQLDGPLIICCSASL